MMKLPAKNLNELFKRIAEKQRLYLPVEQGGQVQFGKWSPEAKIRLDQLKTVRSAKDLFFPQNENLVGFQVQKKNITIIDEHENVTPFVLFGVRACDAASFHILDKVFLADPVDTFYQQRRENGTVVTLSCGKPEETCFCTAFGIDPTQPGGDVSVWLCGDFLYWDSLTEKGNALTEAVKDLFSDTDAEDTKALEKSQSSTREIMKKLPLSGLHPEALRTKSEKEIFDSPIWEQLSQSCLGCGTCTFLCPTCQCFDIRDYDTGHGVVRYRCWDSCMYSDFTKMAAANPRTTQLARFRQRFMHKLVYFPQEHDGTFACVGCGRCVARCPVSMNITKVIKSWGGGNHD